MLSKEELRAILKKSLDTIIQDVNRALKGENTDELADVLTRVGQGGKLPKWYEQLRTQHTLPNLDGKTIGSVIEMLLIAVLEKIIFQGLEISCHAFKLGISSEQDAKPAAWLRLTHYKAFTVIDIKV